MKRVALDKRDKKIRDFIQTLRANADGSILELQGKAVLKALPVKNHDVDQTRLKAAILKRRDQSRKLMVEWEAVDREMWERIPETKE